MITILVILSMLMLIYTLAQTLEYWSNKRKIGETILIFILGMAALTIILITLLNARFYKDTYYKKGYNDGLNTHIEYTIDTVYHLKRK